MTGRLSGKRAIVTGAGRGIGQAIARAFLDEGARVLINDIDDSLVEDSAAALGAAGGQLAYVAGDVANPNDVQRIVAQARSQFGGVDVLVNNAGIGGVGKTLLELSLDEWDIMIRVDLSSVFICCRAVVPLMIEQGRGSIINLSSITGVEGTAGSVPYSAAKAGVIGLTKSLAKELAAERINVNAIAPGLIDTEMSRARGQAGSRAGVRWPRIGQPEDIARLAVYLASDESEFVTGQVISANGGAWM
ncbi:MAG TPA: SDR family NAD(P)-dependent oxidoreductase [Nitrolancea sp.]|jgi:3-oxoacyl-[acyl-carrier protein] reductase|nr:SDR family NAD(P)-dependent oxidoreductase [Nitrolancea sp.]